MSAVTANFSMSLDGFVAAPDGSVGPLFDWYANGPVSYVMPGAHRAAPTMMSQASVDFFRAGLENTGAIVTGRRLFDLTDGWGGAHPVGCPVVLLTHTAPADRPREGEPLTVVTESLKAALTAAQEIAGDSEVAVCGPNLAQQCLNAGLLDEVVINLVPVLFGEGIRFFDDLDGRTELEDPEIVAGTRVTHLRYRVRH